MNGGASFLSRCRHDVARIVGVDRQDFDLLSSANNRVLLLHITPDPSPGFVAWIATTRSLDVGSGPDVIFFIPTI